MPSPVPSFTFKHAGSDRPLAWLRYKLKECWALVLCLLALRRLPRPQAGQGGAVIVHNWWPGTLRFTEQFRDGPAALLAPSLQTAPVVQPHTGPIVTRLLGLGLALPLLLLPVPLLVRLTARLLPKGLRHLGVYCDGHLSGFALVLAAQRHGTATFTLHHGLYRSDDLGSIMGITNFVSDTICLWDRCTYETFLGAGVSEARLVQVGAYGFGHLDAGAPISATRLLVCPPYDVALMGAFQHLAALAPEGTEVVWSLHPLMRAQFKDLPQASVAEADPRPYVAICGDSGALMDALARDIPILTVSDRPLGAAHVTPAEVPRLDASGLAERLAQAQAARAADQARFGFAPAVAGQALKDSESETIPGQTSLQGVS